MKILGLNTIGFNTSASYLDNGKLKCSIEEERLSRIKRTRQFPIKSIDYILNKFNLKFNDFDAVAISWNPLINLEKFDSNQSENKSYIPNLIHSIPSYILKLTKENVPEYFTQEIKFKKKKIKIYFINHHLSHASSYYFSGFKKASILTMDAFGEKQSGGFYLAKNNDIKKINDLEFPHSLGSFYSTFTEICGFKPQSDEWKLMGASAYGNQKKNIFYEKIRKLVELKNNGKFELNLKYFNHYMFHRPNYYNKKLLDYLNISLNKKPELTQEYYDLSFAAQKVFEDILFNALNSLYRETKSENLVFAGGCALNCLANGKIIKKTKFKNIFIPPVPDDSGAGLGAAFYLHNKILNNKRVYVMDNNYLGPSYSNAEVESTLKKYKLKFKFVKNPSLIGAKLISENKIIGWFQDSLEFGDRALGNRSILADPRKNDIKLRINKIVKYREPFRPFAPAVLNEYVKKYFTEYQKSNFMEKTVKVKKKMQKYVPGIVHMDGTARLQTVMKKNNSKFYKLIEQFYKITKIPMVINTSLNYKGDPICCSIEDIVKTFYLSGLDAIIINNYLLEK
jgi:carbamoyltransferase